MMCEFVQSPIPIQRLLLLLHYFPDVKVFAYGSWVRNPSESRDIDLLVVSSSFAGVAGVKRKHLVCRLLQTSDLRIDPICLTPEEFDKLFRSKSVYAVHIREQIQRIV